MHSYRVLSEEGNGKPLQPWSDQEPSLIIHMLIACFFCIKDPTDGCAYIFISECLANKNINDIQTMNKFLSNIICYIEFI